MDTTPQTDAAVAARKQDQEVDLVPASLAYSLEDNLTKLHGEALAWASSSDSYAAELDNAKLTLEALRKEHAAMRTFIESVASAVVMHADWSAGDCIKAEYIEEAKEILAAIA